VALRILGLALEALGRHRRAVFTAILLPAVLLVAADTLGPWATISTFGRLLYAVVSLAAYVWLAIAIHRIVLLEDTFKLRWGWRETRFTGWLFLFSFAIGLVAWFVIAAFESIGMPAGGIIGTAFQIVVAIGVVYFASQYFLIFPAVAVDRKYKLAHSSVDTEDYRMTTFAVVAIFPVMLSLIELPASLIPNVVLYSLVRSLLSIISITIGVAMLSVLFRELSPRTGPSRLTSRR